MHTNTYARIDENTDIHIQRHACMHTCNLSPPVIGHIAAAAPINQATHSDGIYRKASSNSCDDILGLGPGPRPRARLYAYYRN